MESDTVSPAKISKENQMSHMQVNVSNNGATSIKFVDDVEMPSAKRESRGARISKHDYSAMKIGQVMYFTSNKEAASAIQGFNKNECNEAVRALGFLSSRDLRKYGNDTVNPHGFGTPGKEFGVWFKMHPPKAATGETA